MVVTFVEIILAEKDGDLNIRLRYDDMLKNLVSFAKEEEAGYD